MKNLVVFVLLLVATPVYAQERGLTFTVTQPEAQIILNKLGEMPWKDVNPLMQKIIPQLNAQLAPPPKPAEKPPESPQ